MCCIEGLGKTLQIHRGVRLRRNRKWDSLLSLAATPLLAGTTCTQKRAEAKLYAPNRERVLEAQLRFVFGAFHGSRTPHFHVNELTLNAGLNSLSSCLRKEYFHP